MTFLYLQIWQVWFHVDKLSSAHVYLRLKPGETLTDVKPSVVEECAQLVKANSIEGCKLKDTDVVYTMWANLQKTTDMEVGQIGFHDRAKVQKMKVVKNNAIVNRINKTQSVNSKLFTKPQLLYFVRLLTPTFFFSAKESYPNLSDLQQERLAQVYLLYNTNSSIFILHTYFLILQIRSEQKAAVRQAKNAAKVKEREDRATSHARQELESFSYVYFTC